MVKLAVFLFFFFSFFFNIYRRTLSPESECFYFYTISVPPVTGPSSITYTYTSYTYSSPSRTCTYIQNTTERVVDSRSRLYCLYAACLCSSSFSPFFSRSLFEVFDKRASVSVLVFENVYIIFFIFYLHFAFLRIIHCSNLYILDNTTQYIPQQPRNNPNKPPNQLTNSSLLL